MDLSGKYTFVSSDNFDAYLQQVGVNYPLRKIAEVQKPTITITQDGENYTINTASLFKTTEIKFTLNQEFDETTPDGRKVKSTVTRDGDKLVHSQKGAPADSEIVREFNDSGFTLLMTANNVTSKRVYKKQAAAAEGN